MRKREGLRLYYRLLSASFRAAMQHKASFVIMMLYSTLISFADFLVVLAILYRTRAIGGWNAAQIGVLYGIATSAMGIYRTFGCELHGFQAYVVSGDFDGVLLRPWPALLVLLTRQVQFSRLGAVLQGYTALYVSLWYLRGANELGAWRVIFLSTLPLFSSAIFFAIGIASSAVAFWTGRIRELQTLAVYGPAFAAAYPLNIYPKWLQLFLTVIPVSYISFMPVRFALGLGGQTWHLATPFLAAGTALFASLRIWKAGERAYHSAGS